MFMDFSNLKEIDSSLNLLDESTDKKFQVQTISSYDEIKSNSIVYIKDAKILKSLDRNSIPENVVAFIPEALKDEILPEIKKHFSAICSFDSFPRSIHKISKAFFENKFQSRNESADGRKMGTSKVNPDADISEGVFIGENVEIGFGVRIYPGVVILSNSKIGDRTTIYPNVTLYPDTVIGKDCTIHSNCVIGADGFGYEFTEGQHLKVYHIGNVEIGDNVEIGAGSTIDRGTFKSTRIGSGTKIDNLSQIAHNCQMGEHIIMCGQAGLAGSATVEDYVVLGGRSAVAPGVTVGKGAQIAGAAMVTGNAEPGAKLAGHPARPLKEWLKSVALLRKQLKES